MTWVSVSLRAGLLGHPRNVVRRPKGRLKGGDTAARRWCGVRYSLRSGVRRQALISTAAVAANMIATTTAFAVLSAGEAASRQPPLARASLMLTLLTIVALRCALLLLTVNAARGVAAEAERTGALACKRLLSIAAADQLEREELAARVTSPSATNTEAPRTGVRNAIIGLQLPHKDFVEREFASMNAVRRNSALINMDLKPADVEDYIMGLESFYYNDSSDLRRRNLASETHELPTVSLKTETRQKLTDVEVLRVGSVRLGLVGLGSPSNGINGRSSFVEGKSALRTVSALFGENTVTSTKRSIVGMVGKSTALKANASEAAGRRGVGAPRARQGEGEGECEGEGERRRQVVHLEALAEAPARRPLRFTAAGFLVLDRPLVTAIASTLATYAIISAQFDIMGA